MAEVVNLNRVRKSRARDEAGKQAEINRARHGRTKEQKRRDNAEEERRNKDLDGKKVE